MCGIVGYFGNKSPKQVIIDGLRKLEYRGYDSAGVSIWDREKFIQVRASGKLTNLETKLSDQNFSGKIGIGHTRWATHGVPSEKNAHPHKSKDVHLVHNGIIENYQDLKSELKSQGVVFESDTDTEVVVHLLARQLIADGDLFTAVVKIIPRLKGAYSILAVWDKQPDQMVAFKDGPPLVVGLSDDETLIASDIQPIMPHTKKVVYLDDLEICVSNKQEVKFFNSEGLPIQKKQILIEWNHEQTQKQGFKHYMLKEIFEQPHAVANTLEAYIDKDKKQIKFNGLGFSADSYESIKSDVFDKIDEESLSQFDRIFIIACGTSFYAGLYAKYLIEKIAQIPVEVDIASEFRYRNPLIPHNSLVILVSQSGETADTLAVLRQVKGMGIKTLSICNTKRSSIDREAHAHLYMHSGPEIGVASTKAFVCTLTVFNLLSIFLARKKGKISQSQESELLSQILSLPSLMETVLSYDSFFSEASDTLKQFKGFLYLGRGHSYPIAMEGALKLKELAYMHAEGYAAGEMKHGPLALIDEKMAVVVICPQDEYYEKTISNLEEAKARGGVIISIGTGDDKKLISLSKNYLSLPNTNWFLTGILSVIPIQLLAYHMADVLGHDVDQPRNLAKSVTVE